MTECDNKDECTRLAKDLADLSAEKAVRKTFSILGVDVDKPHEVEEFRQDLRFGGRLRRAADKSFITAVTVITVALLSAVWVGIMFKVKDWSVGAP